MVKSEYKLEYPSIRIENLDEQIFTGGSGNTSDNISIFDVFYENKVSLKYSGKCLNMSEMNERFFAPITYKKWLNSPLTVCYFFDPPFTLVHNLERKE
ncbi:hypothetical protein HHI36_012590 [Cryptolaemus montrouzieri]|uniref:Uncharacterized protein n=1 Tax=Cryptolaemus montrouzieri TaxID=559131 RepID=A0ABD2NFA4_9CUCU